MAIDTSYHTEEGYCSEIGRRLQNVKVYEIPIDTEGQLRFIIVIYKYYKND